jgi:hypothetical protein
MPELGVHQRALRLEADEVVAGRTCKTLVEGRGEYEETWAIDAQSWLLLKVTDRKVFDQASQERRSKEVERARKEMEARGLRLPPLARHTEDFATETTTTYEPALDAEIDASVFDFQPPR